MSDKDLIYRAASLLRDRAEAATSGPWVPTGYGDYGPAVRFEGGDGGVECADTDGGWATTRYLPLVAPEVGLALADWLSDAPSRRDYSSAATVARAILAAVAHEEANT